MRTHIIPGSSFWEGDDGLQADGRDEEDQQFFEADAIVAPQHVLCRWHLVPMPLKRAIEIRPHNFPEVAESKGPPLEPVFVQTHGFGPNDQWPRKA